MNALPIYSAIANADPIISTVVEKFRSTNPEFNYKPFTVYNSNADPLFKISAIETLMGKSDILRVIRDDQRKSVDLRLYTAGEDFVHGIADRKRCMFFTRRGFQTYLMTSRGAISNLFRKFLLVVLDELHTKGFVSQADAERITEERYATEIREVATKLEHAKKLLESEQVKRAEAEELLSEAEITAHNLAIISAHQEKRIKISNEYVQNMEEDFPCSKETELRLLKQRYLKQMKVYIYKKPEKKKPRFEHTSSDDDPDVLDFDCCLEDCQNQLDPSDTHLYTFARKSATYAGDLYFVNQDHCERLKRYLAEKCSTNVDGVFAVSFAEMEDKARELFILSSKGFC